MKLRHLIYIGCTVLIQISLEAKEPDHLLPSTDLAAFPAYKTLMRKKLERTKFDCGRIILRPAFSNSNESSISVYGCSENGHVRYKVTCIMAMDSLWDASNGGALPEKGASVKTRRIDFFIPNALAEKLKTPIATLVKTARPLGANEQPKSVTLEGLRIDFSIPQPGGRIAHGEMGDFPPMGPKLKHLQELALDLHESCEASAAERDTFLKKVERNATILIGLLQE